MKKSLFLRAFAFRLSCVVLFVAAFAHAQQTPNAAVLDTGSFPGSSTGGLAEALSACPSTGCTIDVTAPIVITSPQVLTVPRNLPLVIDGQGRTIACSNRSGTCLQYVLAPGGNRYNLVFKDFTFVYTGSGTNVTGFQVGDSKGLTNFTEDNVNFIGFSTPGATAQVWNNVEDSKACSIGYTLNANAFILQNNSNQNQFCSNWFQENTGIVIQFNSGSGENGFADSLIQSNRNAQTVLINGAPNTFTRTHFENNGDGTPASRLITFSGGGSAFLVDNAFASCVFIGGSGGVKAYVFTTLYPSHMGALQLDSNYTVGYLGQFDDTWSGVRSAISSILDNDTTRHTTIGTHQVGFDPNYGLTFNAYGSSRQFSVIGGWPGNYNGDLTIQDITSAPLNLLQFGNRTWNFFDNNIVTTGTLTVASCAGCTPDALANGTTATTQRRGSNDARVATDAYVDSRFIFTSTAMMGTRAVLPGNCADIVSAAAPGVLTTDTILATPAVDLTTVKGYAPSSSGVLTIYPPYVGGGSIDIKVCNNTSASITPGPLTLNLKVVR